MKFRTAFEPSKRFKQHVGEDSMVQQNLAESTDINAIMAKYRKTGILTHVQTYAGMYGDFSGVPDYKTGLERVQAAQEMFLSLPADVREKFGNDPGKFIDFATNKENLPELQKMGLAPIPAPTPDPKGTRSPDSAVVTEGSSEAKASDKKAEAAKPA